MLNKLKEQKEAAAHDTIENDAIDAAVNNATVKDIPQVMLDEDVERQMDQYLAGIQQQGIPADMYFKMTGTSKDDLKKQFVAGADKRVKTSLVLEAIVKAEKINPSEDDVNAEIADLAKQYGMKEEAVRGALSDDMLKHDIGIQKAVSVVVDNAKQVSKNASSSAEK